MTTANQKSKNITIKSDLSLLPMPTGFLYFFYFSLVRIIRETQIAFKIQNFV
jgi:hypothetical protein